MRKIKTNDIKKMRVSIEKQLARRKKSAMPASCPLFSEGGAQTQLGFYNAGGRAAAARETDNYKFRVILSRKVTGGFGSCKQYKGQLLLVTKTVGCTAPLLNTRDPAKQTRYLLPELETNARTGTIRLHGTNGPKDCSTSSGRSLD